MTEALFQPIRTKIMGVLNVTPDSFSDGGNFIFTEAAIAHAGRLISEGADAIDIGGESTRPGAEPVPLREEMRRVLPVIRAIRSRWSEVAISIDTVKAEVARAALAEGAAIVNDVSGLTLDPEMAGVCANAGCCVVVMHSRGTDAEMATTPELHRSIFRSLGLASSSSRIAVTRHDFWYYWQIQGIASG